MSSRLYKTGKREQKSKVHTRESVHQTQIMFGWTQGRVSELRIVGRSWEKLLIGSQAQSQARTMSG